jgi:hypothetical protein
LLRALRRSLCVAPSPSIHSNSAASSAPAPPPPAAASPAAPSCREGPANPVVNWQGRLFHPRLLGRLTLANAVSVAGGGPVSGARGCWSLRDFILRLILARKSRKLAIVIHPLLRAYSAAGMSLGLLWSVVSAKPPHDCISANRPVYT